MNWIGGARQRVSLQGEKKLQKEFFERQKLKKHNLHDLAYRRKNSKKRTISQDIAALQTVNRFSPNFSHLGVDDGQVKMVDLKGYKSTVVKENRVQEVELPHSPITIPSSLHLTDSTSIKAENPKWEDMFKEKTKKHEPKSLFSYHVKQNEVPVKKRPQTCLSEYNSTVVSNISNKKTKLPIDDWGVSSQTVERMDTTNTDMLHLSAQVNNPWASEDFQYDAKYEDMIPWKVNCDFNKKSFKEDINPRSWSQEHFKPFKPSYSNKTSHDNNVPNLPTESYHTNKKHSSLLNPIKPPDTHLEDNFSRNFLKTDQSKSGAALKNHMNQCSKLDSFNGDYSFHSKKPRHNYNLGPVMFSNHHIKSGTCYESYSAYEPDSESTPVNKLAPNNRTGSHPTLAKIKSDFIRKHGDMNSLLDDQHYKMPPRIGNIPDESPWFRFHPSNNPANNQIAVREETPICENPPSFLNNHHRLTVRKSLTPLFDSTQQMAALTPNEISFVKMLSQDQKVMTSFDEESNIGLRDGGTPNFREKSKKKKSSDKSKEMTEVLAELSQLQYENDKDNIENISPVSHTQKTMDSPILGENAIGTIETKVHAEEQPLKTNSSKLDTLTSNEDLSDNNHAPSFNCKLPENNHTHCTTKEHYSKHNSVSTSKEDLLEICTSKKDLLEICTSKEDLSELKQVPSTSTVDLSVNGKISGTTMCHSPILLPDSSEAQDITNRSIGSFEDGKINYIFNPESFNLQVDTRKAHGHKFGHIAKNIDVLTQSNNCSSEQTLEPFTSVPQKDSNAAITVRQKDDTLQLDVQVDMTRGLESKASLAGVHPDPTTSCHLQSGDAPRRQQVDQATQTEVLTKEIALSPIFKKFNSVSVGTQWQSLECYSPKFTQGCVELCEDENNGTQLHTHCNVKDIEKFPTECLSSTQDSFIDNSDSSQSQGFYSLRSRQKCLQS